MSDRSWTMRLARANANTRRDLPMGWDLGRWTHNCATHRRSRSAFGPLPVSSRVRGRAARECAVTTFGLVHGAWHGAWCWEYLVDELDARSFAAIAPDLPIDDASAGLAEYAQAALDA